MLNYFRDKKDRKKGNIRVLNFVPEEKIGGMSLRVIQIACCLRNSVDTFVGSTQNISEISIQTDVDSIRHIFLPIGRIKKSKNILFWLLWAINFVPDVIRCLQTYKKYSINLLHTNGLLNLQPVLAARLYGIPIVWHINDTIHYVPLAIRRSLAMLARIISTSIICTSSNVANYAFGRKWEAIKKIHVLGVPISINKFSKVSDAAIYSIKQKIGFGLNNQIIIGSINNINRNKNIIIQIDILYKLISLGMDAQLVIVGSILETQIEYYKKINEKIDNLGLKEKVFFAGFQNDVNIFLRSFDVFILTSLSESGPMVIIESLFTGTPVVANNVGFVHELPNELGITSIDLSTNEVMIYKFCESIKKSIAEKSHIDVRYNEKYIQEKFGLENISKKVFEIYLQSMS
jgi:glycosyltransferase involved in cell wall biosynthesis